MVGRSFVNRKPMYLSWQLQFKQYKKLTYHSLEIFHQYKIFVDNKFFARKILNTNNNYKVYLCSCVIGLEYYLH